VIYNTYPHLHIGSPISKIPSNSDSKPGDTEESAFHVGRWATSHQRYFELDLYRCCCSLPLPIMRKESWSPYILRYTQRLFCLYAWSKACEPSQSDPSMLALFGRRSLKWPRQWPPFQGSAIPSQIHGPWNCWTNMCSSLTKPWWRKQLS
jgi:hypothetical protein